LKKGHTDIALLGGDKSVKSTYEKRQRLRQLMSRRGLSIVPEWISDRSSYDDISGYREMKRLIDSHKIPSAIIAINDFAAIGIMRAIREKGLRIPEDISLISFDNTYLAEITSPQLSSVDYNYGVYGEKLIDTAIAILDGYEVARVQHIKPNLMLRGSSEIVKI
jgi:LacI family transcriptional regulator